ncbi:3-isopropylmalate dehydratase small subunit [Burkholderia sp. Ac-20379]|uniref:3-isopropylmalate dehydratase small subunit n=1 Tax=Burkholderia sp. Ac-20379 TaxID=2703900 RepID=UPI001982323F|nr:3-isopropylmalate dehydratase small subunit [Burkholderia sp. Ac-20379]MBN3723295.1 3-isopropylmalate dehydratase small subunit [Burkholderia sp. Ac-20379]
MQPLDSLEAVAVPMPGGDIDTDQILPARFMHARRVDYGRYCFHDQRFDARTGAPLATSVLNRPEYGQARMLVVGPNFGCGSSREQAVHTLADFGIRVIVGTTFGDIFFVNCMKNGILPIRADAAFVERAIGELTMSPGAAMAVDLRAQRVLAPNGAAATFEIDGFSKQALLDGTDEIDLTLRLVAEIERYERRRGVVLPAM